ncbi:MAG: RNA 2',3'-cyclic phosphodiesterase [Terriglobia bacterium]
MWPPAGNFPYNPENMRAFIAIDLPESIRGTLRRKQTAFRSVSPAARWTQLEGIHLTLKFLGEVPDHKVREVSEGLKKLGPFEPFAIRVKGFGFFPDGRRPRVFWVGIEESASLIRLAEQVDKAMGAIGFAREERAFRPHLTLARFGEPQAQPALQTAISQQGEQDLGDFEVSEFFLFESRLSPQGAEYRKVERFP